MIPFNRKNFFVEYLPLFFVAIFFLLRLPDFLVNAFVPDEVRHVQHMVGIKGASYFSVENYVGHGSAFWYFGSVVSRFFSDENTFFVLRIISLCSLAGSAFLIIYTFKKSFQENKACEAAILSLFSIFILTLPLFWWDIKLIFPEFFQCFLIAISYYFIYLRKKYFALAFFMLGFCFGLKLHAGAAVAFFVIDRFFESIRTQQIKYFIGYMFLLALGFVLCNPIMLENFPLFISNIKGNGGYFHRDIFSIFNHGWGGIIGGRYPEWDLVYFGGLNRTSLPLANLFLMLLAIGYACWLKKIRLLSVVFFLFCSAISISVNDKFLSYYLFTMVILILLLASQVASCLKFKYLKVILYFSILVNIIITMPNIVQDKFLMHKMAFNLKHSNEHTNCILSLIEKEKNISLVVDNSDVGTDSKQIGFFQKDKFFNANEKVPVINSQGILLPHFVGSLGLIPDINSNIIFSFKNGKTQFLYLDGERTRTIPRYANFIPKFNDFLFRNKKYLQLNIRYLGSCFGTRVNILSVKKEGNL